jgi:predicted aminopeptidase
MKVNDMDRQKLIDEIKGLEKNQPKFSLEDVDAEIQKRKESPYSGITDYLDEPQGNARTEAIEEYLKSPKFRRLFLEVAGGIAGAYTGGAFFAAQAALRPALALL